MPTTPFFICLWRLACLVLLVLVGLMLAALALPICSTRIRLALIKWWCERLLHCFNIKLTTSGHLPDSQKKGVLFVANHISWVDIHAINSVLPVRFVAKLEVKNWPLFGYLIRKSGTIFINRNRQRDAARVVAVIGQSLRQGDNVCVFPEGTTTEGDKVLTFRSSLIQAAIDINALVTPVAIRYPLPNGQLNHWAAYAGETTLADSILAFLRMRSPAVHLHFCAPILASGLNRQSLAAQAHAEITMAQQHMDSDESKPASRFSIAATSPRE